MALRNGIDQSDISLAKNVDLAQFISAYIRLRRKGRQWWGCCPFHKDATPSLMVESDHYHCFGCGAHGDAIAFLRQIEGLGFAEAVRRLANNPHAAPARSIEPVVADRGRPADNDPARTANALRIWHEASQLSGTPGWRYFQHRGIDTDALSTGMDGVLRWHPRCPWESGTQGCVLALYTDAITGEARAIHRTAVTASGEKIGRRALGPKKNCVIRLWPDDCVTLSLVVGEGIETVLSAATQMTHRGTLFRPARATGDAGNLGVLPVLEGVEALTILVDHDESGTGQKQAQTCFQRWRAVGREVCLLIPRTPGFDFNNIAARRAA